MTPSIAMVTGGASGIGREVTARCARRVTTSWCGTCPGAISLVMSAIPTRSQPRWSRPSVSTVCPPVVTCAGIGASGLLLNQQPAEWERVLAVNLTGTWLTVRAGAQAMVDAGVGGSIVAVSSISGTVADRDMGAYCVSKAGVNMLVQVAAVEWGSHGIRVNAVGPGVTRTPMLAKPEALPGWVEGLSERTALGGLGAATDVAGAVVGVLELPWVTGQVVHADGGLALHSPIDAYGQLQRVMARRADKT